MMLFISGDSPAPTAAAQAGAGGWASPAPAAEQNAEGGILNRISKMLGYADQGAAENGNSSPASTPLDGNYKPVGDDAGKYLRRSRTI